METGRAKWVEHNKKMAQEWLGKNKCLIRYLRTPEGKRRAVLVAFSETTKTGKKIRYGWSFCHPRDKFDKYIGIVKALATDEANPPKFWDTWFEETIAAERNILQGRAEIYFQDAQ